jgi:hypothetical protein
MDRRVYKLPALSALSLLGVAYCSWLLRWGSLTGQETLDGGIGIMLGLYICSHPAANAVDLLFFNRFALRELASEWEGVGWLAFNVLVLFVGWMVITFGATRLAGRVG